MHKLTLLLARLFSDLDELPFLAALLNRVTSLSPPGSGVVGLNAGGGGPTGATPPSSTVAHHLHKLNNPNLPNNINSPDCPQPLQAYGMPADLACSVGGIGNCVCSYGGVGGGVVLSRGAAIPLPIPQPAAAAGDGRGGGGGGGMWSPSSLSVPVGSPAASQLLPAMRLSSACAVLWRPGNHVDADLHRSGGGGGGHTFHTRVTLEADLHALSGSSSVGGSGGGRVAKVHVAGWQLQIAPPSVAGSNGNGGGGPCPESGAHASNWPAVRHTSRSAFEVMCDKPFCFACSSGGGDADREGGAPFYLACPSGSGTGAPLLHCTPPSPRIGGAHRRGRMAGPLQIGRTRMTHSGASTPHASTSPFATRCGTPFHVGIASGYVNDTRSRSHAQYARNRWRGPAACARRRCMHTWH